MLDFLYNVCFLQFYGATKTLAVQLEFSQFFFLFIFGKILMSIFSWKNAEILRNSFVFPSNWIKKAQASTLVRKVYMRNSDFVNPAAIMVLHSDIHSKLMSFVIFFHLISRSQEN